MGLIRKILITICLFTCMSSAWAVGRTTPVQVVNTPLVGIDINNSTVKAVQLDPWYVNILGTPDFNIANSPTVKIDGTMNTVKATQSGTWSVGVSSMPTVNVNTHAVTQSGTWNVGINGTPSVNIANTPSFSVSNTPTVRIDAAANAVTAASKHNTVQLSTSNVSIPAGDYWYSSEIDCEGYKEIRALLWSSTLSDTILVYVQFRSPTGYFMRAKSVPFQGSSIMPVECPVYADTCRISIWNGTAVNMTLYDESYVYLVN